ncbi:hypothetical protein XIS1_1790015 [Xenorhabdus innexi]|uniref:Uncharacterized protein n=1 Tax=Xenorhabdus innexi TaxID=290109 RepID=A0A1N6MWU8_9GAMM|nr:hypothetical protein XIS1_1790015 [Xenorhabdus innexi]
MRKSFYYKIAYKFKRKINYLTISYEISLGAISSPLPAKP